MLRFFDHDADKGHQPIQHLPIKFRVESRDLEDFDFLHNNNEMRRTRENSFPVHARVVCVTAAEASVIVGPSIAVDVSQSAIAGRLKSEFLK
jgi:hypothetical protein